MATSGTQDEKNEDMMNNLGLTKRLSWRTKGTQFYQSSGCGQVHNIEYMGTCEGCGRSVYSHGCAGDRPCGDVVTGSPDPRGIIPVEHCMNLFHAREYDMIGRDVVTCYDCAQDGDRYRSIIVAAKRTGTWTPVEPNTNGYIEMMKAQGWKVYQRPVKGISKGEYCYCTDGTNIAYVQWSDGRPQVSTVHKPNRTTGTGFQFSDLITPDSIRKAMACIAPSWALSREVPSVHKYKNWEEFHKSNNFNAELEEVLR